MAGFASFDELISALTVDGQFLNNDFAKLSTAPEAASVWHSLWRVGNFPAAGGDGAAGSGTPGAGGTALTSADGSLVKWADQDPATKHLLGLEVVSTTDCVLMLYDRLVSVSGITLTGTGNKNVGSAALPRYTDGIGVEAWLEVTTATTTTAPIISMNSYTDNDGNTGQSGGSITFPAVATNVDALIGPMPLATGDVGVQAIATVNVSTASGGASAACNVVLLKPLLYVPLVNNLGAIVDCVSMFPSLPRIYDGATLGLAFLASSGTATNFWGKVLAGYN